MEYSRRRPMTKTSISQRVILIILVGRMLAVAGGFGTVPLAYAADPAPDREYVAVFRRGSNDQPFAIIEKPKGVPIGNGSNIEIDAFGLRVAPIEATHVKAFLQRLPELDPGERQKLPPGFTVYANKRYVQASYAGASQKYKIIFTDPADVTGMGGGNEGGGGASGGSM
jgi:hypothetical protein